MTDAGLISERLRKKSLEKKAAEKYFDLKKISFTAVGKTKDEEFYRKVIENAVKN